MQDVTSLGIEIKSIGVTEATQQLTDLANAAQFAAAAIKVLQKSLDALKEKE